MISLNIIYKSYHNGKISPKINFGNNDWVNMFDSSNIALGIYITK